jgi:Vitamin K-dependent gamma-carboxylase
MAARPDMIVQLARHLEDDAQKSFGVEGLKVTARVDASLNGREFQRMIDPQTDLTEVDSSPFTTASFIEPLRTPLS